MRIYLTKWQKQHRELDRPNLGLTWKRVTKEQNHWSAFFTTLEFFDVAYDLSIVMDGEERFHETCMDELIQDRIARRLL